MSVLPTGARRLGIYSFYDADGIVDRYVPYFLNDLKENLEALVDRLKKTSAKLIWAHTSHVPEGEPGRFVGDDQKYNEIAARVMKKNGIEINDLHALTKKFSTELFLGPGDVHYTEAGYARIAGQVTEKISEKLKK